MIGLALLGASALLGVSACTARGPVALPTPTPTATLAARPTSTSAEVPDAVLTAAAVAAAAIAEQPTAVPTDTPVVATEAPTPPSPVAVPTLAVGPDAPLPNPNSVPVPPPGACHIDQGLPDRSCTPGLLNPRLTAAQLCAPGFSTRSIRPPTSYTDALKRRLMIAYGQVGTNPVTGRAWSPNDVELDHDVSLEDLGHPWSPQNLWPEPRRASGAEPNAEEKDQVEITVHELICADQAHAADYAARLAADWTQFRRGQPAPVRTPNDTQP